MAQSGGNWVEIILIGGAAYLAYQWFTTPAVASGASLPAGITPISTSAMSLAQQAAFIAALQAAAPTSVSGSNAGQVVPYTTAQLQSQLNVIGAAYAACTSPNTWTPMTVNLGSQTGVTGGCNNSVQNTGSPLTPPPPVTGSVAQQLQAAAGATVTMLNADQWSFYWQQLNLPSINASSWNTAFFPSGRPATPATMTAQQYVATLQAAGLMPAGLSGYTGYVRAIPVPAMYVRGMGRITLGDLRNAGRF